MSSCVSSPSYNAKIIDCGTNKFAILHDKKLGEGAYAVVKRAVNTVTSQEYAVKILRVTSKQSRETAIKQLEIASQLEDCPNLVRIQRVKVESANNIYIFMEYCDGGTLVDQMICHKGKFREEEIYTVFCHLMNGYRVLERAKVLHEDIKPENVLISGGVYKLADFGLAIFSENYKYTSKRRGTLYYMAFEKLTKKEYTANVKSDIYSLGVLLYQLIVGKHPYIEKRGLEIKEFVREFKDARLRNENLTDTYSFKFMTLFDIVLRMVCKSEEKRIGWEELEAFYRTFEPLEPYRHVAQPAAKEQEFKNATYQQIDRSQASLMDLQLEVESEDVTESIYNKNPGASKPPSEEEVKLMELKEQLTERRNYCYYVSQLIKHLSICIANGRKEPEVEYLLLVLYFYRAKTLPPLEDYDPFDCPVAVKEVMEIYEKDSKFVKEEQISQIGLSDLPEASKKDIMARFKNFNWQKQADAYLNDLISRLFSHGPFMVVRIGYKKQLLLLVYLIQLNKMLKETLPRTSKQFQEVYSMEQIPADEIRKWVQQETSQLMVMYDPEIEKESDEFEVLDWQDYSKTLDANQSPDKRP